MLRVKAFAVGGVDYITKPFSEEVFARVENNLTIRRRQKQLRLHQSKINIKAQFLKGEVSVIDVLIWAQKNLQENCLQGLVIDLGTVCPPLATWQKS